uniref:Glycoprotein-N-acetylgalactosamine 3-beta-galactosyltransferase 1 n=1 Tax=Glossina brevipalpis TaxID=37001 RepID=A0A1A9W858_9MUSC
MCLVSSFFMTSCSKTPRRISNIDLSSTEFVNDSVATTMFNKVRILCWVMTNSENYVKRAIHIKKTWGKRCNKLLFMSSKNHEDSNVIELSVGEGRNQLWNKTKAAFTYIYKYHMSEADWFLKTDDDTNSHIFWSETSNEEKSSQTIISNKTAVFMSGGAGYVLSKEALKLFITKPIPVSDFEAFYEDVEMSKSLQKVHVIEGSSLDNHGQSRFFPMQPIFHLQPLRRNNWFWGYMIHKNEKDCCAEFTVAFHYIEPNAMYIIDFLLYNIQPYGIVSRHLKLPKKIKINNITAATS